MITPGEQYLLLEQEKEEILAEINEALRWKPRDLHIPLLLAAVPIAVAILLPALAWWAVGVFFGYLMAETIYEERKSRARHRRAIVLANRYDMLRTWVERYGN